MNAVLPREGSGVKVTVFRVCPCRYGFVVVWYPRATRLVS